MKKSLLAVAAIGAFASAAQAQSSVTVYGILDVGYVGSNQRLATSTVNKTTVGGFASGGQSTNRLGFKGNEDLGGGASAFFTYEVALSVNDANSTVTASNQNRQAFVGLAKKGLGNAAIGTQYTPIHIAVGATSANGQNNVMGDIIYPSNTLANYNTTTPANTVAPNGQNIGSNAGYTVRTANMLKLQSEVLAGFQATAFLTANGNDSNQTGTGATATGGQNDRNGYGGGLNYGWQKLLITANYQSLKANQIAGAPAAATFGSAAQSGVNIKDNQFYTGATYDFGILKAYVQYINRKATSELNTAQFVQRTAQQIGVKANLTPTIESWASVGNGSYTAFGASLPKANITAYQLGTSYYLSKRTNLYAIYGATGTSNTAGASNAAYNGNNYAVGVRHTF
jgi:predicted porin